MGKRTATRPVAAGRLSVQRAIVFGLTLSALSFVLLATFAGFPALPLNAFRCERHCNEREGVEQHLPRRLGFVAIAVDAIV